YYDLEKKEIKKIETPKNNIWIHLYKPTDEEIINISKILKIKSDDLEDFKENIKSLEDTEEIPLLEKWDSRYFIITRTPQKGTYHAVDYYTHPLGIIIYKEYIITITYYKNETIQSIKTKKCGHSHINFILKLLLLSSRKYLYYLKEIDRKIKTVEHNLENKQTNKYILELLNLEKSLVFFSAALNNNQILYERIYKVERFNLKEEHTEIIEDIIDENRQAIQMTQIYTTIIKDTLDVYGSVISNNLNTVMKILTSITIIIAIPTLIASIYGMNVILPFQGSNFAFEIIMIMCLFFTFLILTILWKKKWL
ncbi:MAG: magnesium transporter CorA family protein, partial [Candidatus ainarchaeum sp.]|nr:magnesium transporter CorA family protein [Candidatus ainarchaeum sp.]